MDGRQLRGATLKLVIPRIDASRPIACRASISTRAAVADHDHAAEACKQPEILVEIDVSRHFEDHVHPRPPVACMILSR